MSRKVALQMGILHFLSLLQIVNVHSGGKCVLYWTIDWEATEKFYI